MTALAATGVCAGLVICIGSSWLLLQAPSSVSKPETSSAAPASPLTRAPLPTPEGRVSALPAPSLPLSREEQGRQLQLEIERALVSVDDAQRERAYTELVPALIR